MVTHNRMNYAACLTIAIASAMYPEIASGQQQPNSPKVAANNPLRAMVWDEALDAGTNVRYWSSLAEQAAQKEKFAMGASIVTGLFCIVFPYLIAPQIKWKKFRWLTVGLPELVGVVAFGFSLATTFDRTETQSELAAIHARWAAIKPQFDELFELSHTLSPDELETRLDALKRMAQTITEPAGTDEERMHQAWVAEMHARGIDAEYIAKVKENRKKLGLMPN